MKRRNKYMNKYRRCPVCKHYMINSEYEFCPHCDWQLDSFQEKYPDEDGCANICSLNEARLEYKRNQALIKKQSSRI